MNKVTNDEQINKFREIDEQINKFREILRITKIYSWSGELCEIYVKCIKWNIIY